MFSGKPVASDLREGKVTMAVIHALERCTPAERSIIETVLRERNLDGVSHQQTRSAHRYGSIDAAMTRAHNTRNARGNHSLRSSKL